MSDLAAEAITLAWRTRFYRRRWHRAPTGSGPPTLGSVPVTTPAAWEHAVRRNPGDVITDVPALWTRTRHADRDLWFPIGHRDLPRAVAHAEAALRRVGVNDGTRMLAVLPPAPSMWNALPYLLLESNLAVEILPLSLDTVTYKPSLAAFPLARQPDVFLASRVLAAELARLAGPLPTWRRTILYLDGGPLLFDERLLALPGCCAPIARCDAGGGTCREMPEWPRSTRTASTPARHRYVRSPAPQNTNGVCWSLPLSRPWLRWSGLPPD